MLLEMDQMVLIKVVIKFFLFTVFRTTSFLPPFTIHNRIEYENMSADQTSADAASHMVAQHLLYPQSVLVTYKYVDCPITKPLIVFKNSNTPLL